MILITCPYERGEGSPRDRGGKGRGGSHPGPASTQGHYLYSIFSVFDCGCGFISVKNLHVCVPRPHQKFCVWWNFDQNMPSRCLLARAQFNWHTSLVAFKRDCLLFLSLQTTAIWWRGRRRLRGIVKTFYGTWALSKIRQYVFMSGSVRFVQRSVVDIYIQFSGYLYPIWMNVNAESWS